MATSVKLVTIFFAFANIVLSSAAAVVHFVTSVSEFCGSNGPYVKH